MKFRGRLLQALVWCLMDVSLLIFSFWSSNGCCSLGLHVQVGSRRKQRSTKEQDLLAIYLYLSIYTSFLSGVLLKEYDQMF